MSSPISIAVVALAAVDIPLAQDIAAELALPLLERSALSVTDTDALLQVDGAQLSLRQTGRNAPGAVQVDFGSAAMRHRRRAGANELLGRAVGLGKKPCIQVLDATAGLGTDSFVLADLGCSVQLFERHPVIAQLLAAGLRTASGSADAWLNTVVARMTLHAGDAREADSRAMANIDVIYLDPMFAPRDKSAAVKKEMALFQRLLGSSTDDSDADALLRWALEQDVARVVVKRAVKAPALGEQAPSHCIKGKAVRYDVHVCRKLG